MPKAVHLPRLWRYAVASSRLHHAKIPTNLPTECPLTQRHRASVPRTDSASDRPLPPRQVCPRFPWYEKPDSASGPETHRRGYQLRSQPPPRSVVQTRNFLWPVLQPGPEEIQRYPDETPRHYGRHPVRQSERRLHLPSPQTVERCGGARSALRTRQPPE